jgi:hypothetical protein
VRLSGKGPTAGDGGLVRMSTLFGEKGQDENLPLHSSLVALNIGSCAFDKPLGIVREINEEATG